jgi:hypothetical protein
MNTKCLKCNNETVNITDHCQSQTYLQGAPFTKSIRINRFLCLSCGFTEEWVDSKDLKQAKKLIGIS